MFIYVKQYILVLTKNIIIFLCHLQGKRYNEILPKKLIFLTFLEMFKHTATKIKAPKTNITFYFMKFKMFFSFLKIRIQSQAAGGPAI